MLRKILLFCFVASLLLGQKKSKIPNYIEHNSILGTTSQVEYLTFRIPYNALLFTKHKEKYKAEFIFSLELYKNKKFLKREINNYEVFSSNYENTNSDDQYFQDFIQMNLQPGEYTFNYTLSISKADYSIKLPPFNIKVKELKKEKVLSPIIVDDENVNYKNKNIFRLTNYQNSIPFAPYKYNLLVGVIDTSIKQIQVSIIQNGEKILDNQTVKRLFKKGISFEKVGNDIFVKTNKDSTNPSYFLISNFSNQLYEGEASLEIKVNKEKKIFPLKVVWYKKPKVLNNPEYAIKLLSYIENISVVKSLLKKDSKNYYKVLFNYWEKKFPGKNKKYNFALAEYYERADYAIKNFIPLKGRRGAETDRGRIYILYGKPSSVDRNYNEKNETIEIWKYKKINKTFIFKDITGTGKFVLVK